MRNADFMAIVALVLTAQRVLAQPWDGLTAHATLVEQRTCHNLDVVSEDLKLDITLQNDNPSDAVLCDLRSEVALTPQLGSSPTAVAAGQFLYDPNIDTFPTDQEVRQEERRLKTCPRIVVPAHGSILVKSHEVTQVIWIDNPPKSKPFQGTTYFTAVVDIRLPNYKKTQWQPLSLVPIPIVLPPPLTDPERDHWRNFGEHFCGSWRKPPAVEGVP
jgi:hypothetical protein